MSVLKKDAMDATINDPIKSAWENVVLHNRPPESDIRKAVLESWHRCLLNRLDPLTPPNLTTLAKGKLNKLRRLNRDLLQIAMPVIKMIELSVTGSGFLLTLTEKNGIVLEVLGDKDVIGMAHKTFYLPGCNRTTAEAGTNAIGLCLDVGEPIQLTGAEHFNIHHHPWTCSSAPIRNRAGDIIGVITLSGRSTGKHKHTLALVSAAAASIEGQLRERDLVDATKRLNSILTSIYDAISDGFIALDQKQTITHFNSAARRMLGLDLENIIGKHLLEIAVRQPKLMTTLDTGESMEATEISFKGAKGVETFICRVDPIHTQNYKILGHIITMAEQRQILNIAKKIGGNYAKYEFSDIKGRDPEFLRQIKMARIAAKANSRVLILGESGTGKELFAQAIHNHSNRSNGPFVAISCAAIPRDLIESELFGYKGGAFTGARQKGMIGKFELANGGTLFLDETNGMPLELQGKLLRALQQNEIMRLGDNRTIPIDVRVIAASNTDLMEEVEHGNFREDLYYRLNVMEINIPPLRERLDDIELLMQHIMDRHCRQMGLKKLAIAPQALQILKAYDWPGNVRELENLVERALLLCDGDTILKEHLPLRRRKSLAARSSGSVSMQQGVRDMIESTLERCHGNVSQAAKELGIARSTLYRKMAQLGIH